MEMISFGIGAVGLVGAFTACVDCFKYVRVGRRLGEDYQISLIKLDFLMLRFTRWGEAVGIAQASEDDAVIRLKAHLADPDRDLILVTKALGQILELFKRADTTSKKMAHKVSDSELKDEEANEETNFLNSLHIKMQGLAIRRQKQSDFRQKAAWALYGRNNFDRLIANLHEIITELVDLVPSKPQQELCKREISEIATDEDLAHLDDILQEPVDDEKNSLDNLLRDALSEAINKRRGSTTTTSWKRSKVAAGSKIQQGNCYANGYEGQFPENKAT